MGVAVFLDRDGVINKDGDYVHKIDDFIFIDHAIDAMKMIKDKGYSLIVVTNQSGIARGFYTEDDFMTLTEWMDWSLMDRGVRLDGIYYCPHHPEGKGEYACDCDCRKPKPGMILEGASYRNVDLTKSYMVGDKAVDMQAGIAAGIKNNYLVRTGHELTEDGIKLATGVFDDLLAFAQQLPELEGSDRAEALKPVQEKDKQLTPEEKIGRSLYGNNIKKETASNKHSPYGSERRNEFKKDYTKNGNHQIKENVWQKDRTDKNKKTDNSNFDNSKFYKKSSNKNGSSRVWGSNANQGDGFTPLKKQSKIENCLLDRDDEEME